METIKKQALVFAICITSAICSAQQPFSSLCPLGNLKSDAEFAAADSVLLDCSVENIKNFKKYSGKLKSLHYLVLRGNSGAEHWEGLLERVKTMPSVKSIVFSTNGFETLPYGFEKLSNTVNQLTISNNDNLDYYLLSEQLRELPNVQELQLDILSVFDLPDSVFYLKNVSKMVLVNKDKAIADIANASVPSATYDFYVKTGNNTGMSVKYISMAGVLGNDEYDELNEYFQALNFSLQEQSSDLVESAYIPSYQYIKPPIEGLDVPRDVYSINPAIENVLTYPSGTKILIPASAFADKNGNPVSANVSVSYREFRDPVDFLVSGIPMKYDSGGTVNNFESAGMFELYASTGKEPLQLAKGRQIKMDFVATSSDSTYNFYEYNDSTGNWSYKGKPTASTNEKKIKTKMLSDAYTMYGQLLQSRPTRRDSTGLNQRFESVNYVYTSQLDTNFGEKKFMYYEHGDRHTKRLTNLVKITRVRKNKAGDIVFKVKFESKAHPEMEVFNNVYFLLADNISVNQFKKEFYQKKFYNDIRIYRSGNGVEIKLKGIKQFKTINAEIVTVNDKGAVKRTKDLKHRLQKYEAQLKKKDRDFKKGRRDSYCDEPPVPITDPVELSMYAYKECKKYMSREERKMNYESWINYYNEVMANQRLAASNAEVTRDNLVRSLSLDNMGIFNCDQIQRLQNPVEVFAQYNKNNSNGKVSPEAVYIIDKKINAVLQYNGYRGYGPEKIAFSNSTDAQNVLLAINKNGTMAIYRTEDFKQNTFAEKTKFTFSVEELGNKYATVGELKKSIGL